MISSDRPVVFTHDETPKLSSNSPNRSSSPQVRIRRGVPRAFFFKHHARSVLFLRTGGVVHFYIVVDHLRLGIRIVFKILGAQNIFHRRAHKARITTISTTAADLRWRSCCRVGNSRCMHDERVRSSYGCGGGSFVRNSHKTKTSFHAAFFLSVVSYAENDELRKRIVRVYNGLLCRRINDAQRDSRQAIVPRLKEQTNTHTHRTQHTFLEVNK